MEKDRETLAEGMEELLEDLRESLGEALSVAGCVKISAEAACEDTGLIRGMGAVVKLLTYTMGHELVELEKTVEGMQG